MKLRGSSILCTGMLFIMASSVARADPDGTAPDQPAEIPPVTKPHAFEPVPLSVGVPLTVYVPNLTPGLEFSAGLLFLKPGADNLGYATITTFLPIGNPQWAVEAMDPNYQPGFSVGARYALPSSGNDILLNWEHLRTSDSAYEAVGNPATQWISPFSQTGPSTSEASNFVGIFHLKAAHAQLNFDYDMANIDVAQTVNIGANTQLRLFAGVSSVRLREQLVTTFYNNPNIEPVLPVVAVTDASLNSLSLNNTSTYTGVGPHLGFSTTYNLSHGFTFLGQLSGAIYEGWTRPAQYTLTADFQDVVNREQISSRVASQVVYSGDVKVGLGYSCTFANGSVFNIETGFKAAVFVDPFSTYETSTNVLPLDIGSLSTNSMRHTQSNFTLSGFYATCGLKW